MVIHAAAAARERYTEFDQYCTGWEDYTAIFLAQYKRAPVIYDIGCEDGLFSRGAQLAGAICYGFDNRTRHRDAYDWDAPLPGTDRTPSGMIFKECQILDSREWTRFEKTGSLAGAPPPDMVHIGSRAMKEFGESNTMSCMTVLKVIDTVSQMRSTRGGT